MSVRLTVDFVGLLEGEVGNIALDGTVFGVVVDAEFVSAGEARATFGSWGIANIIVPITYWLNSNCEKYYDILWLRATLNLIFDLLWAGVMIVMI